MLRILVTDGEDRHSLAIIRSLGRQGGMNITSLAHDPNAISFLSRYVSHRIIAPESSKAKEYGDFLLNTVAEGKYDMLVVCTEPVINILSSRRDEFAEKVNFALPPLKEFNITNDKIATLKFAMKNGIPVPRTEFPQSVEEAFKASESFEPPFIIKGSKGSGAANVRIVYHRNEFEEKYNQVVSGLKEFEVDDLPMLQEFVEGDGYGFSTIYNNGKQIANFMHTRLLQYPSSAGQCVIAHQVLDEELKEIATRLFDALNWHSVGMAEFRKDRETGEYKLMEINPRFWGSVELPIRLGIDFANLYRRLAMGEDLEPCCDEPHENRDFLFLFPHTLVSFLESPKQLFGVLKKLRFNNTFTDIDRHDIRPLLRQLRLSFWHMRKHLRRYGYNSLKQNGENRELR